MLSGRFGISGQVGGCVHCAWRCASIDNVLACSALLLGADGCACEGRLLVICGGEVGDVI